MSYVSKSKSNFIRNAACTRTNISIIINCHYTLMFQSLYQTVHVQIAPSQVANTLFRHSQLSQRITSRNVIYETRNCRLGVFVFVCV